MSQMEKITKFISSLSEQIKVPIKEDSLGLWLFHYQEMDFSIEWPPDSPVIHFYAALLKPTDLALVSIYEAALVLNLFMIESKGGAIAMDPNTREIIYCHNHPFSRHMKFKEFQEVSQHVLVTAPHLKKRVTYDAMKPPPQLDESKKPFSPSRLLPPYSS